MKTLVVKLLMTVFLLLFVTVLTAAGAWAATAPIKVNSSSAAAQPAIPAGESIPLSELGARAGKKYSGEALSVIATKEGARLRTDFQRLQGEVTEQGLALESTVAGQPRERFALAADALGREGKSAIALPRLGRVETEKGLARWLRPGITEEYSVSVDGVKQDFVITERPEGDGPLRLVLALSGARAESASYGARITLAGSGRRLAYSRLKAWDAAGRELPGRMAAAGPDRLTVVVEDAGAVWPLRIDPTFSDDNWISMGDGNGMSGSVDALAFDGSGNLYAGGNFTYAGNVSAKNIAKWNGINWSILGSGMNGWVNALAIDGSGNLYAGGDFTTAGGVSANYIAKWNGSAWSPLGSGMNTYGEVNALAIDGSGNLYAGGYFTTAGGVSAEYIARWNGSAWSPLGPGMFDPVTALAFDSSGNLYAGGQFTATSDLTVSANHIAKWDGGAWSPLGSGVDGYVQALAFDGSGNLYAGGDFTTAGGVSANHIAKWDGGAWSPLGNGLTGTYSSSVNALAIDGSGNLYAGGDFTTAGGMSANYIAKWDGSAWSTLGTGMSSSVNALAIDGTGNLYAGGLFTTAGGVRAVYIAKWNGAWSPLGNGLDSEVSALAIDGSGNLYVGGGFTTAGGVSANHIAKWDGGAWSPLGSGVNGPVSALAIDGSGNLYAGGNFITAGGVSAKSIAKWNGSAWSPLGAGVNGGVTALAIDGSGNLYAGGNFTTGGGASISFIAKWSAGAWSSIGSGVYGPVNALAIDGLGNLYAGGYFTTAGGVSANCIAKWNGSAWSPLGSGMDGVTYLKGTVYALAADGSGNLYAGGAFTIAGGLSANYIAKWNGIAWSPFGSGMNGQVNALTIDSSNTLYAGGQFTTAGGVNANYIAKWDGGAWSPLGSGVSGGYPTSVNALSFDGSDNLYAGGAFTTAGGKGSSNLAKAALNGAPVTHFRITAPPTALAGTAFSFTVTALDQSNNTAIGYTGTVHFTSSDTLAMLPANTKLTKGNGMFSATLNTAGSQTIKATDIVTASITGTSDSITIAVPLLELSIAFKGNGSGTVTSTSPASPTINCNKGSSGGCSADYPLNTPVTLAATPDWKSVFTDWSGGLTSKANPLTFNIGAGMTLTANFDPNFKAKLLPGGAPFAGIQDAYASVSSGSITIQSQVWLFMEDLLFSNSTAVTLTGGMNSDYIPTPGYSTVKSLSVGKGSLVIGNIIIR